MRALQFSRAFMAKLGTVAAIIGLIIAMMSPAANANAIREANNPVQIKSATGASLQLYGDCYYDHGYIDGYMNYSTNGPKGTAYLNIYKRVNGVSYLVSHKTQYGYSGDILTYVRYQSGYYWFATWGFNSSAVSGSGGTGC